MDQIVLGIHDIPKKAERILTRICNYVHICLSGTFKNTKIGDLLGRAQVRCTRNRQACFEMACEC